VRFYRGIRSKLHHKQKECTLGKQNNDHSQQGNYDDSIADSVPEGSIEYLDYEQHEVQR